MCFFLFVILIIFAFTVSPKFVFLSTPPVGGIIKIEFEYEYSSIPIPFGPKADIFKIVKLQIEHLKKMIGKQDIYIDATDEAIEYLARKGYQPEFGARPVKRVIQKEVLNQLSKDILSGKVTTDSIILLDAFDDQLVFRNQSDLVQN